MSLPPPLRTPLAATAAVIAGLLLLAIPLRHMTTAAPAVATSQPPTPTAPSSTPAWITLKLLAPAEAVTLATPEGTQLWTLGPSPAGDQETRLDLPLVDGRTELILHVERALSAPESAAFLTIAPDGMEERTAHAIGTGSIHDALTFDW